MSVIDLCAHVTLKPDNSKITVFNKGRPIKDTVSNPLGGQIPPI